MKAPAKSESAQARGPGAEQKKSLGVLLEKKAGVRENTCHEQTLFQRIAGAYTQ